jgi:Ser/Thr protein kinase RdoA (MazF antagonist)
MMHHMRPIAKFQSVHTLTRTYRPTHTAERWNYSVALCHTLAERAAMALNTVNARNKLKWHSHELSQLQLPASLPKGICHADFHFSNVLFKDDTLTALLDFDDANYTFLLFDLVGLIESWAWPYATVVLNFPEAKKVVSEYMTRRSLNNTEKRSLFDVYKLSILMDSVWYFARGDVTDFHEKRKLDYLNAVGRAQFYHELVGGNP